MKKLLLALFVAAFLLPAGAQTTADGQYSGTNSPYSQYGLGLAGDHSTGFNHAMNGVGIGMRENNQVNVLNPASYSALDSLTFIFDVGVSGQMTNFKENGRSLNVRNADFDYAVAAFRLVRHVGMSFGLLPFTNVGYNYQYTQNVGDSRTTTYTNTYNGSGGLNQAFIGMGWEPLKGLSVGVNGAFLWGQYNRSVVNAYSDNAINTLSKYYSATVSNYTVDFGLQYSMALNKKDRLTIGGTYSLGHKLGADPECLIVSNNALTGVADSALYVVKDGLEIPSSYGVGLSWYHGDKWKVGADFSLQQWSKVAFPAYQVVDNVPDYVLSSNTFQDCKKVNVGGEYCPGMTSRGFLKRIRYRLGAYYATPQLNINGKDGPREYGVSAGFGIPVINTYNNRSILNISGQWVRTEASGLLKENTFRVNIGLTFNERWFMKWKVD